MNHFRALVIVDNNTTSMTLKNALTRLGCHVTVVPTTDEARVVLGDRRYDAVFAELCARGDGGGRGIARWLKSRGSDSVCFILTGWKGELEKRILRDEGIDGVIRKPLIFNEIRDEILDHFG